MRNERGIVLVTVMVLLVVVTFIGMMSISTTTTGIKIGGNKSLKKRNMHAGEAGIEYSVPLIGETVYDRSFPIAYDSLRPYLRMQRPSRYTRGASYDQRS